MTLGRYTNSISAWILEHNCAANTADEFDFGMVLCLFLGG